MVNEGFRMTAYGERIARVEVEVRELKREFQEHKEETAKNFSAVNQKLDALLALRNKGAGVVWLLSGAGLTGFLAVVYNLINWFRS
jgi:hypothetical protein